MKVFASDFLEKPSNNSRIEVSEWKWTPENAEAIDIYATGSSTSSRQSTYAAEKDNRSDSDRPNEGMHIA